MSDDLKRVGYRQFIVKDTTAITKELYLRNEIIISRQFFREGIKSGKISPNSYLYRLGLTAGTMHEGSVEIGENLRLASNDFSSKGRALFYLDKGLNHFSLVLPSRMITGAAFCVNVIPLVKMFCSSLESGNFGISGWILWIVVFSVFLVIGLGLLKSQLNTKEPIRNMQLAETNPTKLVQKFMPDYVFPTKKYLDTRAKMVENRKKIQSQNSAVVASNAASAKSFAAIRSTSKKEKSDEQDMIYRRANNQVFFCVAQNYPEVKDDPFIMSMADDQLEGDLKTLMNAFSKNQLDDNLKKLTDEYSNVDQKSIVTNITNLERFSHHPSQRLFSHLQRSQVAPTVTVDNQSNARPDYVVQVESDNKNDEKSMPATASTATTASQLFS